MQEGNQGFSTSVEEEEQMSLLILSITCHHPSFFDCAHTEQAARELHSHGCCWPRGSSFNHRHLFLSLLGHHIGVPCRVTLRMRPLFSAAAVTLLSQTKPRCSDFPPVPAAKGQLWTPNAVTFTTSIMWHSGVHRQKLWAPMSLQRRMRYMSLLCMRCGSWVWQKTSEWMRNNQLKD